MKEIARELRGIAGENPATAEEMKVVQDNLTLSMPGSRETSNAVASTLIEISRYGLPDDYYETYSGKVRALTAASVTSAAQKVIRPGNVVWVVVGDRAKIEGAVKALNFGELRFVDADGNVQ